jgi:Ser/Thr protein kinase RdoA (MazF antagonist)
MMTLEKTARHFADNIRTIAPLGRGLINDTFLVTTSSSRWVLQRVNQQVFPEPALITANLLTLNQTVAVLAHAQLQLPKVCLTRTGAPYLQDGRGDFWRAQSFITNTESLETLRDLDDARQVGFALGHFHRLLSHLEPAQLHDTLPGFHITPTYLQHYRQAAATATVTTHDYCAAFIAGFAPHAAALETAKHSGLLPLRVIHGDPKLNNFLFDKHTHKVVSLIDLDTVKPGLVHYDIGDCLRSCCHDADSDRFNLEVCAAILEHYLGEAAAFFSAADYAYLYPAIRLIPFELGLRFYTDYLQGNRYFKVSEPAQNLHRAIAQFRLCESIMAQETDLKALITRLSGKLAAHTII